MVSRQRETASMRPMRRGTESGTATRLYKTYTPARTSPRSTRHPLADVRVQHPRLVRAVAGALTTVNPVVNARSLQSTRKQVNSFRHAPYAVRYPAWYNSCIGSESKALGVAGYVPLYRGRYHDRHLAFDPSPILRTVARSTVSAAVRGHLSPVTYAPI